MPRAKSARPVRSMTAGLVRLKTRADFVRVAAGRSRAVRPAFIVQAAPQPTGNDNGGILRVGFTASRKVGNAVVRNRAKRRLRAIAAEVLPRNGRPGTDYVIVARATSSERRYADLVADLETALRQLDRQRAGGAPPKRVSAAAED
jgi:ribonuclease P protein component